MNHPVVKPVPASQSDEQARASLESKLTRWWMEILGIPHVGPHSDFFQFGARPWQSTSVLEQVRQEFGVAIRMADLYEARTISKLADLIEIKRDSREQLCIVPIRATGTRLPLFVVHGVGGNILGFAGLARSLSADQPVYGIQAQALNSEVPTLIGLEAMAAYYIEEMRRVQPAGPYALLGFSFGGLVVYEIARQLSASGEQVRFLGMLDTWQPGHLREAEIAAHPWLHRRWNRLNLFRLNTQKLSLWQTVPYVSGRLRSLVLRMMFKRIPISGAVSLPESMRQVRDINLTAAANYVIRPYVGRITLFRAKEDTRLNLPEDLNWRAYAAGGVDIVHLPGDHGQILAEPNLSFMTAQMEERLPAPSIEATEIDEFELDDEGLIDLHAPANAKITSDPAQTISAWTGGELAMSIDSGPGMIFCAKGIE